MTLLAASPIALLLIALFIFKLPLSKASPLALVYTAVLGATSWQLSLPQLNASILKGLLLSADILLIVFGAICFLRYNQHTGALQTMQVQLGRLTSDRRAQAVLLAWLFGSFIEGVSGFGTPAAIVAPLLVGIGFSPSTAVVVSLLANSTAVTFGAVGTPVRLGLAGLDITHVPSQAALVNLIVGPYIPLMILATVVRAENPPSAKKSFLEFVPWTLFCAFGFLLPYALCSRLGYEFPSIIGGIAGLALAIASLRFGLLLPRKITNQADLLQLGYAFVPYIVLLALLIAGKLVLSSSVFQVDLGSQLSHAVQVFNPGFAFLTTIGLLALLKKQKGYQLIAIARSSMAPLVKTAISIFCIGSLTYVLLSSGMLHTLSQSMLSPALQYYSAAIGVFGAFLTGSATVSNLLFAGLQANIAHELALNTSWILAMQLVGAGIGNMIALSNILAVQAAVGTQHEEAKLLKRLLLPCLTYLSAATVVAIALSALFG